MNDRTKKIMYGIIAALVFAASVILVVIGQRNIGPMGLLTMFVGLAGLVVLLWIYNRQYK
ncbi:MAG: hypothetical protein RR139_11965 [Lachnospiraceae bacterium]